MMSQTLRGLSFVLLLALSPLARAETIGPLAPPGAPASAFPKPDRPVAEIISPIWATETERDAVKESERIIAALGLEPGMSVADLGAGSGYHTVRLARALGPDGRVFAQDVMPKYLADLARRVRQEGLTNVTLVRGEAHDPRLSAGSVDAAILVHMYHEIAQPFAFLYNLVPALKPGARVGIVDLDRPIGKHGTPPDLLRCELAAVGYEPVSFTRLTGEIGYLAVFTPPAEAARTPPEAIKPCRVPKG
jgi:SAM-dependent methyltransferase